ncbi:alpha-isopropylmalate synthase regulatory domain-containing protein [Leptolyngbya sp. FACHB-36]|uniref:alpha-isopropylmalate synthase regulatory domain-containing protein n=1 Tax=Leptolyngbya sp. FACHB-36 TaxID=2692808 RepID=UPI001A7EB4B9|nr:alpha-isopropylmalate synthase regulatory domain-containing protein [Leptolyngbya sp. FACHB-36]
MRAALITLNVFQNSLAKQDPRWRYYVALLRRLSCQPVLWYMTAIDYCLAWIFWTVFELEDELCQEAYLGMLRQVTPCPIDQHIWDESGYHPINFCDALRLACAIDRNVDAIVTWEPDQFAQTADEHQHVQSHRYFYKPMVAEGLEPDETLMLRLGVFSVAAFLLNFSGTGRRRFLRSRWLQCFRLEALQFGCSGSEHQASITLCDPTGEYLTVNASGDSPFDAIQQAIDQVVDRYFEIPARQLSRFYVPQTPILGANATVEVVICIECGDQSIQKSASHSNMLRAAAEAYVKVINDLCRHPDMPIVA